MTSLSSGHLFKSKLSV
uniref:Uncharacterized protein n=1 Tax=Arundo donax TaxID=35708 RepID=A0A0A9B2T0_ARUDO